MKNSFTIDLAIDNIVYSYDSETIKTIKLPTQVAKDIKTPEFCIISQTMNVTLVDKDGFIFEILKSGGKKNGYATIYLNNMVIGTYNITNVSYDVNEGSVDIDFNDDLIKLQQKTNVRYLTGKEISFYAIIENIFEKTLEVIGDNYVLDIDARTERFLKNTVIAYGYVYGNSLWEVWNKIAECGLLNIFLSRQKFCIRRFV